MPTRPHLFSMTEVAVAEATCHWLAEPAGPTSRANVMTLDIFLLGMLVLLIFLLVCVCGWFMAWLGRPTTHCTSSFFAAEPLPRESEGSGPCPCCSPDPRAAWCKLESQTATSMKRAHYKKSAFAHPLKFKWAFFMLVPSSFSALCLKTSSLMLDRPHIHWEGRRARLHCACRAGAP